jgi:hypothetical protein
MAISPLYQIPLLDEGAEGAAATVNIGLIILDIMSRASVIDRDLTAPPGSPADGDLYIVAASPTGAWTGHATDYAMYSTVAGGWLFAPRKTGKVVWIEDEAVALLWNGTVYKTITLT